MALALLAGCSMSLPQHALVAVSASHALKAFSKVVDKEMNDDFEAHGGESMPAASREKRADEWDRKLEILHGARDLVEDYGALVSQADKSGDSSVLAPIARRVVAAWVDVLTVADELAVPFPAVPARLLKFVEGSKR